MDKLDKEETNVVDVKGIEPEAIRRQFLNSSYQCLAGLMIHDIRNAALQRPFHNLLESISLLLDLYPMRKIELKISEGVVSLCGDKIQPHFSIVESMRLMIESFDGAQLETITFEREVQREDLADLFSKWALHRSVGGKPRPLNGQFQNIHLEFVDPAKIQQKLKNRQLLVSPSYALKRYFLLKQSTEDFFAGVASNELKSHKELKRNLLELVEIARVAPYNLVALSLIRPTEEQSPMAGAVGQALATSLLSVVLARELEFSFRDQVNLGLVGLLYNVGLIGEETSLVLKNEKLSPVEYKRVLDAQASGVYKLIRLQGSSRPVLERLLAIFEHSKGPEIKSMALTLESRLLRLVSQYVALTSDRPFRDAYTPSEAIRLLGSKAVTHTGGDLDPILYYVFVRLLGVYPVGSVVLLSDGKKGVVFRPFGEKMGAPLIKLCPEGDEVATAVIDLGLESSLSIMKPLESKREGVRVEGYFFD
jgi:hypothetical protein